MIENQRIGLALGGGGARGAVHVGVIQELEALQIRPNLLTGTSFGALVAALYASGLSPEEMTRFFDVFTLPSMYALPGRQPSLAQTNKLEQFLEKWIGRPRFHQLQIPAAFVATDLVEQKEVILDEGDVISAVLASLSFPILFPPYERRGRTLVDGGLMNNVPFDVARSRGASVVIAVDLANAAPYGTTAEQPPTSTSQIFDRALNATKRRPIYQVMTSVTDIITQRATRARLAISPPDILIRPYIGTIGLLDFHLVHEAIQIGREAVWEAEPALLRRVQTG